MVGFCNWILKCKTPDGRTFHSEHGSGNWKAFGMSPTTQRWMQSDLGFHNLWNKSVTWFLMRGYSRSASLAVRLRGLSDSTSKRKQYIFKSHERNPFLTLKVLSSLTFTTPSLTPINRREGHWPCTQARCHPFYSCLISSFQWFYEVGSDIIPILQRRNGSAER